jgi:hypothetical protein
MKRHKKSQRKPPYRDFKFLFFRRPFDWLSGFIAGIQINLFERRMERLEKQRDVLRLIKVLNNPRYAVKYSGQAIAASALGRLGDTRAIDALLGALKGSNRNNQRAAAWALGRIGDVRAVDALKAALKNVDVREPALEALIQLHALDLTKLLACLKDKNEPVRKAAAAELGALGDRRAVEPLVALVENDMHASVQKAAAEALGRLGDGRSAGALLFLLFNSNDENVRKIAEEALHQVCDAQAVEMLLPVLAAKEITRRRFVAETLVGWYTSGGLDEETRQLILQQRETIMDPFHERHSDRHGHDDKTYPDNGCVRRGHTDLAPGHDDRPTSGIGVYFPL